MKKPVPAPPVIWPGRAGQPPATIQSKAKPVSLGVAPPPTTWPGNHAPVALQQKPSGIPAPPIMWPGATAPAVLQQKTAPKPAGVAPPPIYWPGGAAAQTKQRPAVSNVLLPVGQRRWPATSVVQPASRAKKTTQPPGAESKAATATPTWDGTSLRAEAQNLVTIGRTKFAELATVADGIQEIQAMTIGGEIYYAANKQLGAEVEARVRLYKDLSKPPKDLIREKSKFETLRRFASAKTGIAWILGGYHAEQNLLFHLAKKIGNGKVKSGTIVQVYGTKPPCVICRRVMDAYNTALSDAKTGIALMYDRSVGDEKVREDEAGLLDLASLAGGGDATFREFVAEYQKKIHGVKDVGGAAATSDDAGHPAS